MHKERGYQQFTRSDLNFTEDCCVNGMHNADFKSIINTEVDSRCKVRSI